MACHKFRGRLIRYDGPTQDLVEAIHIIYTSTLESVTDLRKELVHWLSNMPKKVFEDPKVKTAVSSYGILAYDLLRDILDERGRTQQEGWERNLWERGVSPSSPGRFSFSISRSGRVDEF